MQKVAAPLIGANDDVEAIEGKRNYYRASKQVFERLNSIVNTLALPRNNKNNFISIQNLFEHPVQERGQQQQKILATFALSKCRDTNHLCMSLKELFNGKQRFLSTIVIAP